MDELTDKSQLEYGKAHRGKPLVDVPASYLIWLHDTATHVPKNIINYVADNYNDLLKEAETEKNATKSPYGN